MTSTLATFFVLTFAAAAPNATSAPSSTSPPDPRTGERLDGRPPPEDSRGPGAKALRVATAPVRGAAWLVLRPIDWTVGALERNKVPQRIYEALTSDDRLIGVRPSLRYQPGYAPSAGVRYFDRRTMGPASSVEASLRGGTRAVESTFILQSPPVLGGAFGLQLGYLRRNDAVFGGLAGETRDQLRAAGREVVRYMSSVASATILFRRKVARPMTFEIASGIDSRLYGNGISSDEETPPIEAIYCTVTAADPCVIDPLLVPGFDKGIRLLRAQAALSLDTRNDIRFGGGIVARLAGGIAHGYAGDHSRHATMTATTGGIIPLGDRSLGVHVRAGMVEPLGDAPVPFDDLLVASGPQGLRGLAFGRLRGPSELVGSVEYRWLIAPLMDAVLFLDRGNAYAARFADLSWKRGFTTAGIAFVLHESHGPDYWQNTPAYGFQLAVTDDAAMRLSFAMVAL